MNLFHFLTCPPESVPPTPSIIFLTLCLNIFQENVSVFPGLRLPEQMWFSVPFQQDRFPTPGVNLLNSSHPFGLFPPCLHAAWVQSISLPKAKWGFFSFTACNWIHFKKAHTLSSPLPTPLWLLNYRYTAKLSGCKNTGVAIPFSRRSSRPRD